MDFRGEAYLVVVDYLSTWIDILPLSGKSASDIISVIKPLLSIHGIPSTIIADNMPFGSREFTNFAKAWDINVTTSSPLYPQSNGLAERAVGIAKKLMQKSEASGIPLELALLEHHNTPVAGLSASPAQILMSRQLRSNLPVTKELLKPKVVEVYREKLARQEIIKKTYDRNAKCSNSTFNIGDNIVVRNKKVWLPAQVVQQHESPRSFIVKTERGELVRRNTSQLKQSLNAPNFQQDDTDGISESALSSGMQEEKTVTVVPPDLSNVVTTRSGRVVRAPNRLDI